MQPSVLTVSQLNRYVKALLEEQKPLGDIMIKGEVSDVSFRPQSGQLYFTLGDDLASLRCVMFSRGTSLLRALPQDGDAVLVRGQVSLYERAGQFQLIAYDIQALGQGALSAGFEELRRRLAAEGLFSEERKRPFPRLPAAVGVVASGEGAAVQDIIRTMELRNPLVRLILYPALAQGENAPASIVAALHALAEDGRSKCAIIARGGGSSDDLSAYNAESVVRAAAACPVPVVSAVGHESDYTLLDLAADARAATPTAACALVCMSAEELLNAVSGCAQRMDALLDRRLRQAESDALNLTRLLHARSPAARLGMDRQRLAYLTERLSESALQKLRLSAAYTESLAARLRCMDPRAVFTKGYSVTLREDKPLFSVAEAAVGETLRTRLRDGTLLSTVTKIERN